MAAMQEELERQKKLHSRPVFIYDIPLLFEAGSDKNFDIVILVFCSPEIQLQRLISRDKISPAEAERTLSMQFPIDSKKDHSDYIIENSGELERTLRQVDELWTGILKV